MLMTPLVGGKLQEDRDGGIGLVHCNVRDFAQAVRMAS
jgi:hypothetical protein